MISETSQFPPNVLLTYAERDQPTQGVRLDCEPLKKKISCSPFRPYENRKRRKARPTITMAWLNRPIGVCVISATGSGHMCNCVFGKMNSNGTGYDREGKGIHPRFFRFSHLSHILPSVGGFFKRQTMFRLDNFYYVPSIEHQKITNKYNWIGLVSVLGTYWVAFSTQCT